MIETTKINSLEYIKECVISDKNSDYGNERKVSPVRVNPIVDNEHEKRLKISGEWKLRLDPEDVGIDQHWFKYPDIMTENIIVPGCIQGQGFGNNEDDEILDFRLKARTFKSTYKGTVWYSKKFNLPVSWKGSRIMLNFGGVHPSACVWLNGVNIGCNVIPFVPFGFDVSDIAMFDTENILVVQVYEQNRILGFTYNYQGNWSGLYRDVELVATGHNHISQFLIYPDVQSKGIRFKTMIKMIENMSELSLEVSVYALDLPQLVYRKAITIDNETISFEIPIDSPLLWSPDFPSLYRVDTVLKDKDGVILDALSERTGFIKLSASNKHFCINDEPFYMRGTGDFISCPETICPDTNRDRWRKKLRKLREYGYNYVRCQSFVYNPEYFDVADEVGLIVQSEMGMLGNCGGQSIYHIYPWPQPTIDNYELLKEQWDKIVLRDVNHPSANIYCMSNEYKNNLNFPRVAWQCYHETKRIKPTAFIIWTDGGYREDLPSDFVNDEAGTVCDKPLIQHEFRWWSSFPDVQIIDKYSGGVRPYAAELALKTALYRGIAHILPDAAINSQREQFIEAKYEMESCRRINRELAGICHFNAMDINLSPQGILDEFFEKKYADSVEWLQTNGDSVVLCDLSYDTSVYSSGEILRCSFFVSDFSHPFLKEPVFLWKLVSEDVVLCQGKISYMHIPYCTCDAGKIEILLPEVTVPKQAKLIAEIAEGDRVINNNWYIWLFPKRIELNNSIVLYEKPVHTWLKGLNEKLPVLKHHHLETSENHLILTETLDEYLMEYIRNGGRVVFSVSEGLTRPTAGPWNSYGNGRYFFSPPANYPPFEDGINGTIIKNHPSLGDLPHEGFADLQFFRIIGNSAPIDIGSLGLIEDDPIIRCIHSYVIGRPLAYLVEYSFGIGGIIMCSMDLNQDWTEARYLLSKLCEYVVSDKFKPNSEISKEAMRKILVACKIG